MQKIIEIEQHLLFFINFFRVPKYRVRPIVPSWDTDDEDDKVYDAVTSLLQMSTKPPVNSDSWTLSTEPPVHADSQTLNPDITSIEQ